MHLCVACWDWNTCCKTRPPSSRRTRKAQLVQQRHVLLLAPLAFCILSFLLCPNAAAQINIAIVPNKTEDVAPFKLFVDASGTTASGVEDAWAFHDLHYVWDFGDPSSGTWTTNGKSRNNGFGATYGHVFERPGKYTA